MAQLSDDCFVFGGTLMSVDDAARLIAAQVPSVADTETIPLKSADGRIIAEDFIAPMPLPPFDNSAVDGYAVRHGDLAAQDETRLRIVDRVQAGRSAARAVGPGEAVRIFTGAPMPPGADTVFMQEDCRPEGDSVVVPAGLKRGANMRFAGEDVATGSIAIPAGQRMSPAEVALVAALGATHLAVRRRVRVALFSTGDEVFEPGGARPAAGIYDSNRYLLMAMLRRLGADVQDLGILPDDAERLAVALKEAAGQCDLLLTSGGVSTGEADHVRAAVETNGRLVFWRLAIKPGRPVAMGVVNGTAFVGVPGNPVAAFVTFITVVRPLILRLGGGQAEPLAPIPVQAGFRHRKKRGRREYLRVTIRQSAGETAVVDKFAAEGAGLLTSITRTSGLAVLPEELTEIEPGGRVDYLPYASLLA
jgi:molybdopterin molybdotransferase